MGLVADGGEPIKVTAGRVSDNLFKTLGTSAALGRTIEPGSATPGQPRVAVLSDSLWRTRFNADPSIIGRTILLDSRPHTDHRRDAAGLRSLPSRHRPVGAARVDAGHAQFRRHSRKASRGSRRASLRCGDAQLVELVLRCAKDLARPNQWGRAMRVQKLQEAITGDVRPALLILLGAVG